MKRSQRGAASRAQRVARPARAAGSDDLQLPPAEERELWDQVLQDTASMTHSIAEIVLLKEGDLVTVQLP